ncbi:nickel pincer cofactor biosynthesis protein LarC [Trichothermofontia sp.]
MPIAYFDCPTGIAGDMCLGALVSAGVPLTYLADRLRSLGIDDEYTLTAQLVYPQGQQATQVQVTLTPRPASLPTGASRAVGAASVHSHNRLPHTHPGDPDEMPATTSVPAPTAPYTAVRHLPEIEALIQRADLPPRVEQWSLAIFQRLAIAEGSVHGIPPEQVHFHEVGATDAIVDIVGTCLGLDWLGIDSDVDGWPLLYCSALPTGGGTVRAAHGRLPVPVPAVLKLWEMRQVPIYGNGIERELVTPTGAAIVTTLARQFGPPPAMHLEKVGVGAGTIALPMPNVLRLWVGKAGEIHNSQFTMHHSGLHHSGLHHSDGGHQRDHGQGDAISPREHCATNDMATQQQPGDGTGGELSTSSGPPSPQREGQPLPPHSRTETIAVLQTQIDDLSPQVMGYVAERLLAIGALEVFTQAIGMKKNRPGILLTVICYPDRRLDCEELLFRETTTLGIRHSIQQRSALGREIRTVQTPYGPVRLKLAWFNPQTVNSAPQLVNVQPEYEDCAQLARQHQVPWREVHRLALAAGYQHLEAMRDLSPGGQEAG